MSRLGGRTPDDSCPAIVNVIRRRPVLAVFVLAVLWLLALEETFRASATDRLYFHAWTSEYMMQTVSLGDLRIEPFKSLWYNHIQPPVFDGIRAVIAAFYPRTDPDTLMRRVDAVLYGIWLFLYGAMASLVFGWIRRAVSFRAAALSVAVFLLLPGPVFYATFLDGTFLSSLLLLWFFFTLWRLGRGEAVSGQLLLVCLLLFLTRSVFQWPFLVVLAVAFFLMGIPRKPSLKVLAPLAVFMAAFLAKQYILFGLTTTSSFGPDSFCKGLSEYCHGTTKVDLPKTTDRFNAFVLRRAEKLNGEYNYNQEAFLKRSFSQMEEYKTLLRRMTLKRALHLLGINLDFYLRPTSRHSAHVIVDRVAWREPFEWVLSGWRLIVLLLAACGFWLRGCLRLGGDERRRALLHGLGLALPALYVAAVTIVFESGENMRYRFFLEPTMAVFVVLSLSTKRRAKASASAS